MANQNLRDGIKTGNLVIENISGNLVHVGKSLQMSEHTFLIQSGAYTSAGAASVYNTFSAAFATATPVVHVMPVQAAGFSTPFVPTANVSAGSFAVSGGVAHTGNYIAFGIPTSIST